MTLPSSVRPKRLHEVEESNQFGQEKQQRLSSSSTKSNPEHGLSPNSSKSSSSSGPLSHTDDPTTLQELFMKAMKRWLDGLGINEKKTLTRVKVNRRALVEASKLKLPGDKWPDNWFQRLRTEAGMICYMKKSSYIKKRKQRKVAAGTTPKAKPKFVDLTTAPPPGWWLQAYANGKAPPRTQGMFFDGEQVTIYWDYKQENWKDYDPATGKFLEKPIGERKTIMLPHDGDGVMSQYMESLKKQKERDELIARSRGIHYDQLLTERHLKLEKLEAGEQTQGTSKGKIDSDSDFY